MIAVLSVAELLDRILRPGALVFDVGAHLGTKSERYLSHDAGAVCVEQLPESVWSLEARCGGDARITVLAWAVGEAERTAVLQVCTRAPYLLTLSELWKQGRFSNKVWDRRI